MAQVVKCLLRSSLQWLKGEEQASDWVVPPSPAFDGHLTMQPWLACGPVWSETHSNPSASASWGLELNVCASMDF